MIKAFLAVAILISACLATPARAQDAAAPFDGDLQRLAEILGALHYLRGICGSNEGAKWRYEMQALVDADPPPAPAAPAWSRALTAATTASSGPTEPARPRPTWRSVATSRMG